MAIVGKILLRCPSRKLLSSRLLLQNELHYYDIHKGALLEAIKGQYQILSTTASDNKAASCV
jgi:hypothetical protein